MAIGSRVSTCLDSVRSHPLLRAVGLLRPERGKAVALISAGALVALFQVAEPLLFGKAINALAARANPLGYVGLWCALSLAGFLAGMVVSLGADRMAHRRRLTAMSVFVEHLLALPPSFHNEARSGRLMRIMISGCETLFSVWLPMLREQFTNTVILLALLPIALWTNWRLALVLIALMIVYVGINMLVMRRTSTGQAQVESRFTDISGRLVICSAM